MITGLAIALIVTNALALIVTPMLVGKERKPITPGGAATMLALNLIYIVWALLILVRV